MSRTRTRTRARVTDFGRLGGTPFRSWDDDHARTPQLGRLLAEYRHPDEPTWGECEQLYSWRGVLYYASRGPTSEDAYYRELRLGVSEALALARQSGWRVYA